MDLKNHSELGKFIDLLRKKGVESIKHGDFEIKLSNYVPESNYKKKKQNDDSPIEVDQFFTDEDALYWSSTGAQ